MRRRSRRGPNISESTGKIGQELPPNQPAPLVPSYLDEVPSRPEGMARPHENRPGPPQQRRPEQPPQHRRPEQQQQRRQERPQPQRAPEQTEERRPGWDVAPGAGRLEVETQPEIAPAPVPQPNAQGQTPKGFVVLAIGLPGSGKTTWFGRRGITPLSSDLLRNILFDDVEEQRYQGLVFSTLRSLLRARLIARMPMNYVDATNLSAHERRQWIKMAKSFGYEVQAVFFDVPLEVCLERNRARDRSVSEDVMRKMAEKLKPPVFEEGFEKITVVRVKSGG